MRNNTRIALEPEARCEAWGSSGYVEAVSTPPRRRVRQGREPLNVLENLVETQVIPRLLLAHHLADAPLPAVDEIAAILAERVGELSELVIAADAETSVSFVTNLREQGISLESLFQDLLAPTARRLGELWDEDINDFADVTRGMSQLQLIVRTFSNDLREEVQTPSNDRRALLLPLPGEQHSFGVSLVAEHFRREGWRVWGGPPQSTQEMLDLVRGQWFDVVGLSASKLHDATTIANVIANLRRTSLNRHATILIGGKVFSECPQLVSAVGADGTGIDGPQALSHARALLGPYQQSHCDQRANS